VVAALRSAWRRVRRLDPVVGDGSLAAVLVLLSEWELVARPYGNLSAPPSAPLLVVLMTAPLAWRRRNPLAAYCVQVAAWTVTSAGSGHWGLTGGSVAAVLLGAYSVGAYGARRAVSGAVVVVTSVLAPTLLLLLPTALARFGLSVSAELNDLVPITAWLVGHAVRGQRRYVAGLEERARRLEREREATTRAAIAEERARIAHELHDVVAHGVSVMVVQAEAARRLVRRRPEQAEEAMRTVSATGSEALAELQHLLGVLGAGEHGAELEPAPGLRDLDTLLERVRGAGMTVELRLDGPVRPLPRGLDLTAYRIVQEALTNVLKHAGTAAARVHLRYRDDRLAIEVADDGLPAPAGPNGAGRGLVGMRERVAAYGGELEAGPGAGGGFSVRAALPLEAPS
jgi:signal transduction histidine kinase